MSNRAHIIEVCATNQHTFCSKVKQICTYQMSNCAHITEVCATKTRLLEGQTSVHILNE